MCVMRDYCMRRPTYCMTIGFSYLFGQAKIRSVIIPGDLDQMYQRPGPT